MATENKKFYGKGIETIVKFVKKDDERGQEYGGYANILAVPVVAGGVVLTEYQQAMIAAGKMEAPEATEFKDSETFVKIGTNKPALKDEVYKFIERLEKRQFKDCYAYISGTPSVSEYKDGRKFVNLSPEIITDLKDEDLSFHINLLKKTGELWDGVVRPKESVVKTETTSNTYANAWD